MVETPAMSGSDLSALGEVEQVEQPVVATLARSTRILLPIRLGPGCGERIEHCEQAFHQFGGRVYRVRCRIRPLRWWMRRSRRRSR